MRSLSDWWLAASVARELGVARTTLLSACDRGLVRAEHLGDGTRVVSLSSARAWAEKRENREIAGK
jgi:hypothetical protein